MRTYSSINFAVEEFQPDQITWNEKANKESHKKSEVKVDIAEVFKAKKYFSHSDIVKQTALMHSHNLSAEYEAQIYLKREDHQRGRTYKIRGAYFQYLISDEERKKIGYIVVSDGNFAASYSIVAGLFKTKCVVFVPETCHVYKLAAISKEGKQFVDIIQIGHDFQECAEHAVKFSKEVNIPILKSYQTPTLFSGYATIAKEITENNNKIVFDYILVPAGGGGLASAIASMVKQISPETKVIAVEPDNCKPYSNSILKGSIESAQKASKFCNGSSVKTTSQIAYEMGKTSVDGFVEVSELKLAEKMIKLYSLGIICQPSGALSVTGLDKIRSLIKGKNVACILSGANIDLTKLDQAREMSAISKGIKNFYVMNLPNKRNIIYQIITKCFKPTDMISVQYSQRVGKQTSQVLISVESLTQEDVEYSYQKLIEGKYQFENINEKEDLMSLFF